ncbi:hypothetical protein Q7P37_003192 [Cladosporium fusiforme]
MHASYTLLALAGGSKTAYAWGALGHQTIGYIASNLVGNDTRAWAQAILNDTSDGYIANIASWADQYRRTDEGSFSSAMHYIDSEDSPPEACNVDFERDCNAEEGCVVSAIANYTQRVQQPAVLDKQQINYALRFIVHFLGDITQPLHTEALELGGNGINVTFDDEDWNLHAVWDTAIPEQIREIENATLADAKAWAEDLTESIKHGKYKYCARSWIQGDDIADAQRSAMAWARDTNALVCTVVLGDGREAVESVDLAGAYFDKAVEDVEIQIAKGGYRLAHWLEQLAAAQQSNGTTYKRSAEPLAEVDLSGREFLPAPRPLSKAKLARRAFGSGCAHGH